MFPKIKKFISEYKRIKYLAYHDALTGLLNRNWLHYNALNITHKYVYFIDINDLKKVNKSGHTSGDNHIKKIVNHILDLTCENDIFVRYAGDEFLLFSDRKNVIETNGLFSVGCSVYNNKHSEISIRLADQIMIVSKIEYKFKIKFVDKFLLR